MDWLVYFTAVIGTTKWCHLGHRLDLGSMPLIARWVHILINIYEVIFGCLPVIFWSPQALKPLSQLDQHRVICESMSWSGVYYVWSCFLSQDLKETILVSMSWKVHDSKGILASLFVFMSCAAFNELSPELVEAAQAHCQLIVVSKWVAILLKLDCDLEFLRFMDLIVARMISVFLSLALGFSTSCSLLVDHCWNCQRFFTLLQMVSYQNSSCIDCWPRVADHDHQLIWELMRAS